MKKLTCFLLLAMVGAFTACVPAKKYNELQHKNGDLRQENGQLHDNLTDCRAHRDQQSKKMAGLTAHIDRLQRQKENLKAEKSSLQRQYQGLKDSYDALQTHSATALADNAQQNRKLLAAIEGKRDTLRTERKRLQKLKKDLAKRGERIDRLEAVIAAKKHQMKKLKDNISAALTDFEGKGLSVYRKNGKVYVSMENKLLFPSASWAVNKKGRKAVKELGKVLAENPNIHVLIVGNTDNVPYRGRGNLSDNWDLSTKRATAIVRILLENKNIDARQLTAAGRSKYMPVASNQTAAGRAKNRRIDIVLTPEYRKLAELLEQKN